MGWNVMCFGEVEVEDKDTEKVLTKLNELAKDDTAFCVVNDDLTFEMSGNKGVPYGSLELLKEWSLKEKISMTITTNEYSETGGGFYFDSNDYEAEEEKTEKRISD